MAVNGASVAGQKVGQSAAVEGTHCCAPPSICRASEHTCEQAGRQLAHAQESHEVGMAQTGQHRSFLQRQRGGARPPWRGYPMPGCKQASHPAHLQQLLHDSQGKLQLCAKLLARLCRPNQGKPGQEKAEHLGRRPGTNADGTTCSGRNRAGTAVLAYAD